DTAGKCLLLDRSAAKSPRAARGPLCKGGFWVPSFHKGGTGRILPAGSFFRLGCAPNRPILVQVDPVQPCRILAHDLLLHLFTDALEVPRYRFARARPSGHQMRVVARPHLV